MKGFNTLQIWRSIGATLNTLESAFRSTRCRAYCKLPHFWLAGRSGSDRLSFYGIKGNGSRLDALWTLCVGTWEI